MEKKTNFKWIALMSIPLILTACSKDHNGMPARSNNTITIENVLESEPLVESGTFQKPGVLINPGSSSSFTFSAAKGQAVTFATMYGWSNDLFFAPDNPGIKLYDGDGNPIEGDVSSQVKLWDNGTRINQQPGASVNHPGTAESSVKNITEVDGMDAQKNKYLPASSLMKVTLKYNGNSTFTLTIKNTSGGTLNETPFSPGVWAVSYIVGGDLLSPNPTYMEGKASANGLTDIAEMGNNKNLSDYLGDMTGIFTPLSPVLVVIYNGIANPIYKVGENDEGHGLTDLAQKGDASGLADYLKAVKGVKNVYVLPAAKSTVLLPVIDEQPGSSVSQQISVSKGDKIAIATMYGFSNDWFFATTGEIDATQKGDISSEVGLFDDGTAINQFPGAGLTQVNLAGMPQTESKPIEEVPNPNEFTTLPEITHLIKVMIQ